MRLSTALVGLLCAASLGAAEAQLLPYSGQGGSVRTRADLERILEESELALSSPVYSESVKRTIRADANQIRRRLRDGDFRVGDRIVLFVQGETELPDTVAVEPGPMISLPLFGEISLAGVLRSEITSHLTEALSRYIRDPVVRANGHMRLSVQGQVARPGFYTMPAEMLLGEALMVAGGPTNTADMDGIQVDRGSTRLLAGEFLQEAMREGLTLDQLNLQAGDQIVVPERTVGGGFMTNIGAIAGVLGSLGFLVVLFIR